MFKPSSNSLGKPTPRYVILDGMGINLKSTAIAACKLYGIPTLESDSHFYLSDLGLDRNVFPYNDKYSVKLSSRWLSMYALGNCQNRSGLVAVDRGVVNQLVWCDLANRKVVDIYDQDLTDSKGLLSDPYRIKELEDSLGDVTRFLLVTENRMMISDALDPSKEGKGDSHTDFRIETFVNPDRYFEMQKEYLQTYDKFTRGDYRKIVLSDGLTYDEMSELIVNEVSKFITSSPQFGN